MPTACWLLSPLSRCLPGLRSRAAALGLAFFVLGFVLGFGSGFVASVDMLISHYTGMADCAAALDCL